MNRLITAALAIALIAPLAHSQERASSPFVVGSLVDSIVWIEAAADRYLDAGLEAEGALLRHQVDLMLGALGEQSICAFQVYVTDPCDVDHYHCPCSYCMHHENDDLPASGILIPIDLHIGARRALRDCPTLPVFINACDDQDGQMQLYTHMCRDAYPTSCYLLDRCDGSLTGLPVCDPPLDFCLQWTCGTQCGDDWPGVPFAAPQH